MAEDMFSIPPAPEGRFPLALLRQAAPLTVPDEAPEKTAADAILHLMNRFHLSASLRKILSGPCVTKYLLDTSCPLPPSSLKEMEAALVKALDTPCIRLQFPLPGTACAGIEVPKALRRTVPLRQVLGSEEMQQAKKALPTALGVDLAGRNVVCDLSGMPHLLLAGSPGSGKSVCLHSMLLSLMHRLPPEEVHLLLSDPTQTEFTAYASLPYLRHPVESDALIAIEHLESLTDEMLRRYALFRQRAVRNIDGYNAALSPSEERLPRILFVADELAHLMQFSRERVETAVSRLSALGRGAGIHLLLATRHPSPDVLTGMILSSIPARIAFRCAAVQHSRLILNQPDAEKLLGQGDMLYMPYGSQPPLRVQGCFVSVSEVEQVTAFLRKEKTSAG